MDSLPLSCAPYRDLTTLCAVAALSTPHPAALGLGRVLFIGTVFASRVFLSSFMSIPRSVHVQAWSSQGVSWLSRCQGYLVPPNGDRACLRTCLGSGVDRWQLAAGASQCGLQLVCAQSWWASESTLSSPWWWMPAPTVGTLGLTSAPSLSPT